MIGGRYRPTGSTTAGGMGEIIECLDTRLKRRVVIKTLRVGEEERRILDEQKALAQLRSKHVVQLYDVVNFKMGSRDVIGLVLEYIDGENLDFASFKQGDDYLRVLWQIASGLSEIHAAGIIHRDIKPNNIRMDSEGVIKIIDFGLARSFDSTAKTRSVIGTPIFMAPELWGSGTISFSRAIDVYAFGVTAIALLTDSFPSQLEERPPRPAVARPIAELLDGVPDEIVESLTSCLAYDADDRPKMTVVRDVLARAILKDRHRALIVMGKKIYNLDYSNRGAKISNSIGSLSVRYDGYDFVIREVDGDVFINNYLAAVGDNLPMCCVITFGRLGGRRRFVTFDTSNPEVIP